MMRDSSFYLPEVFLWDLKNAGVYLPMGPDPIELAAVCVITFWSTVFTLTLYLCLKKGKNVFYEENGT
jgi:hypothetical protein